MDSWRIKIKLQVYAARTKKYMLIAHTRDGIFYKGLNKQFAAITHRVTNTKRKIKHFGEVKIIE